MLRTSANRRAGYLAGVIGASLMASAAVAGEVTSERLINSEREPGNWLANLAVGDDYLAIFESPSADVLARLPLMYQAAGIPVQGMTVSYPAPYHHHQAAAAMVQAEAWGGPADGSVITLDTRAALRAFEHEGYYKWSEQKRKAIWTPGNG